MVKTNLRKIISTLVEEVVNENIIVRKNPVSKETIINFLSLLRAGDDAVSQITWTVRTGDFYSPSFSEPEEAIQEIEKYSAKDPDTMYAFSSVFFDKSKNSKSSYSKVMEENEFEDALSKLDIKSVLTSNVLGRVNNITLDAVSEEASMRSELTANAVNPNRKRNGHGYTS